MRRPRDSFARVESFISEGVGITSSETMEPTLSICYLTESSHVPVRAFKPDVYAHT